MELRRDSADDAVEYEGHSFPQESKKEKDVVPDLLPEHCTYRDEGCEFAISCLSCPFPDCILEQPGGRRCWLNKVRDREIIRLHFTEGKGTKELAQRYRVSLRTVQRVLRRMKSD